MMSRKRSLLALLVLISGSYAAMAADAPRVPKSQDEALAFRAADLLQDPATQVLGNPNGDLTIVQFFDYQCPFTKAVEPRVEAFLKADGNVRLIVKEFPILSPESRTASKAALASVKQGKYAAYHDAMLAHQGRLTNDDVFRIARDVGLDVDRLKTDMNAPEVFEEIITNLTLARDIKVSSTPSFIINGKVLTQPSAEMDFAKIAAEERAKAKY